MNIDNKTLFWYTIISIIIIYIFARINISLGIIYGTFIVIIILYYANKDYNFKQKQNDDIKINKKNLIIPNPNIAQNYIEIVNFLFSIQDFYVFNPLAYEKMINHLDNFFQYYNETINNKKLAGINYNLMLEQKRSALNSLQSLIITFCTDVNYMNKFNNSITVLEELLDVYMKKVEYMYKEYLYHNGNNTSTQLLMKPPFPINMYDDVVDRTNTGLIYSYDIF
jgi:hypothetical protein